MTRTVLLTSVLALATSLVAGCAVDGGPAPAGEEAEAEVTALRFYDCNTSGDMDQLKHVELGMSATEVQITDLSKDALPPDSGKIDPTYRPTPAFAGSIRYAGFDKLVSAMSEVSRADIIVTKEFQASPAQGKILFRTTGPEGGGNQVFFCKSKPKKLAVATSLHARLACNVSLECTNDNPPGQTCLDSAFVNQTTDGGATLRVQFLDHFGVHAEVRKVEVGASNELNRTSTTIKAAWNDHKLDLTYRAGVTYLGTLKLPNGKEAKAKCNDLAMLD